MNDVIFDATAVEPLGDFDALPAGKYLCVATESIEKPTKDLNGKYLEVTLQIIDGQFKGRLIWDRFNLANPSEKAVEMGKRKLAALCLSMDLKALKSYSELHNKPVVAIVKQRVRKDTNELTNEIRSYVSREEAAKADAAPATGTVPWVNTNASL